MYDYDERLELAPRDVVARAIVAEIKKLQTWCVYLDVTHLNPKDIHHQFPTIWAQLRSVGIEMEKEWIPIVPAQHYSCGGVVTDVRGRTNVAGLYAAGEVACTGVHGANRLASNSLLEALVYGRAAGADAVNNLEDPPTDLEPTEPKSVSESDAVRIRHSVQKLMTDSVGIVRTTAGLQDAQKRLADLQDEEATLPRAPYSAYAVEAVNILVGARYVVEGALARKENVGLHYNEDLIKAVPNT
jgi:L-aspartate oxidase